MASRIGSLSASSTIGSWILSRSAGLAASFASSSSLSSFAPPKFQAPMPPSPRPRSSGVNVVSASVIAPPQPSKYIEVS